MCIRDSLRSILRLVGGAALVAALVAPLVTAFGCLLYTSDAADDLTRFVLVVSRFFQAEDGIRDLVRSRGLGDVYKRQFAINPPSCRRRRPCRRSCRPSCHRFW